MLIRPEQIGDDQAIHDLTTKAFEGVPHSSGNEARIVQVLRTDGDLTLSLVAVLDQKLVGHIAFSPVTIDGRFSGWYGLGPVSVQPELQRTGIGSALIKDGLAKLETIGAVGCALIGDPNYYSRFGFVSDGLLSYKDVPNSYVQWLAFGTAKATGSLSFCPAFDDR